ncbi:MAG: cell division protein FtsA [Elusimicrobia bacterium GWA2_56_46]|nr:MAG: cell division protein FtsA [Elusimicrobia bacterium GWA2_56_46]OGR54809.1 MAG: cell division protein FtsA [Elusimicrobia bacterium GWC2_56_31]HBB66219.1 cell division protein FtsA [Elusimicrobiota bacterium]HBW23400.1 cell division protein FtsA [Elusimicrobiota bacterium]
MAKSDIIAGLDMGSSRVTCVLAEHDPGSEKIRILAGASAPCKGLKGGVVVNIAETQRAIANVMEAAEEKAKEIVGEVYLGVRGGHFQTFNNRGAYNIARADKEITAEDVSNVIENAKAIPIPSDREILHVIPQGFSLDRQRGVPNPVGMEGALLEVGVHIVTAQSSHINNLMKSVSQAGFRVVDTVYNLLAIGELVVSPEEKDLGCLLIDIGGQTTAVGVYYEGSLHFSSEIPLGGDHVTRDIAYGLGTSMSTAQEIKEKYGAVLSSLVDGDRILNITGLDARTKKEIKARDLLDYVQPRTEEMFERVNTFLQNCNSSDLPGGAILTGGGALLKGMNEAAEQLLELKQARYGFARPDIIECPEEYLSQTYTSAIGLVCYQYLKPWANEPSAARRPPMIPAAWWRWVKDLF